MIPSSRMPRISSRIRILHSPVTSTFFAKFKPLRILILASSFSSSESWSKKIGDFSNRNNLNSGSSRFTISIPSVSMEPFKNCTMMTVFPFKRAVTPRPKALAVFPFPGPQITCIRFSFIILHLMSVLSCEQFSKTTLAQFM